MSYSVYFQDLTGYKTPSKVGTKYKLKNVVISGNSWSFAKGWVTISYQDGTTVEIDESAQIVTNPYHPYTDNTEIIVFENHEFEIKNGANLITYKIKVTTSTTEASKASGYWEYRTITIYGVPNKYPLKPWTNKEVIERTLQLVEPIRQSQTPRFSWQAPEGKEKAFAEFAPEYTFTRLNLRECLQTIGGRIHAEPRLKTVDGKDTITFDFYGEQEYATIKNNKTNKTKRLSSY